MRCTGVLALAVGLISSVAAAQPGADDTEPPPPPPTPPAGPAPVMAPPPPPGTPAQPASEVDEGVVQDANSGRNWLTPTALTPPAGTWSFSDFELILVSLGYAVTDKFTVSGTFLLPIVEDMPFFGIASAKYQVLKAGNLRGALQLNILHTSIDDGSDDFSFTASNVGGALTLCIDTSCHSHVTGYLGAGFGLDSVEDQNAVPFVAAAAAAFKVGRHIKLVFEADTAFVVGSVDEAADGLLGWYGLRFTSKFIGVDLGFAKPICEGCSDEGLPMGFPFVSFTYRGYND